MAKSNVKPGTAGIWIGVALIFLSLVSCVGGVGWGFAGFIGQLQDVADNAKERVPVNSSQEYQFKEDGASGVIIGVAPSSSDAKAIDVTLEGPDGEVDLTTSSSFSGSGDVNGEAFEFLASFSDQKAGTYTLSSTGPEGASVAIVPISIDTVGQRILGGIGIGAVLFLVGLVLMIVTFSRRRKAKQAMATVGGPPPAMGGGFGAPPAPAGFGAPPAPQAPPQVPPPGTYGAPQTPAPPAPGGFPPQQAPVPEQPQPYAPAPEAPPFTPPTQQMPPAPPAPPQAPGGYPPPPPPPSGS